MKEPARAEVGMGIQYFPLSPPACTPSLTNCFCFCANLGGSCTIADYATPDVPIQLLPGVAPAITNSLNAHSPGAGTPTDPALQCPIQYAQHGATAHPTLN